MQESCTVMSFVTIKALHVNTTHFTLLETLGFPAPFLNSQHHQTVSLASYTLFLPDSQTVKVT